MVGGDVIINKKIIAHISVLEVNALGLREMWSDIPQTFIDVDCATLIYTSFDVAFIGRSQYF